MVRWPSSTHLSFISRGRPPPHSVIYQRFANSDRDRCGLSGRSRRRRQVRFSGCRRRRRGGRSGDLRSLAEGDDWRWIEMVTLRKSRSLRGNTEVNRGRATTEILSSAVQGISSSSVLSNLPQVVFSLEFPWLGVRRFYTTAQRCSVKSQNEEEVEEDTVEKSTEMQNAVAATLLINTSATLVATQKWEVRTVSH